MMLQSPSRTQSSGSSRPRSFSFSSSGRRRSRHGSDDMKQKMFPEDQHDKDRRSPVPKRTSLEAELFSVLGDSSKHGGKSRRNLDDKHPPASPATPPTTSKRSSQTDRRNSFRRIQSEFIHRSHHSQSSTEQSRKEKSDAVKRNSTSPSKESPLRRRDDSFFRPEKNGFQQMEYSGEIKFDDDFFDQADEKDFQQQLRRQPSQREYRDGRRGSASGHERRGAKSSRNLGSRSNSRSSSNSSSGRYHAQSSRNLGERDYRASSSRSPSPMHDGIPRSSRSDGRHRAQSSRNLGERDYRSSGHTSSRSPSPMHDDIPRSSRSDERRRSKSSRNLRERDYQGHSSSRSPSMDDARQYRAQSSRSLGDRDYRRTNSYNRSPSPMPSVKEDEVPPPLPIDDSSGSFFEESPGKLGERPSFRNCDTSNAVDGQSELGQRKTTSKRSLSGSGRRISSSARHLSSTGHRSEGDDRRHSSRSVISSDHNYRDSRNTRSNRQSSRRLSSSGHEGNRRSQTSSHHQSLDRQSSRNLSSSRHSSRDLSSSGKSSGHNSNSKYSRQNSRRLSESSHGTDDDFQETFPPFVVEDTPEAKDYPNPHGFDRRSGSTSLSRSKHRTQNSYEHRHDDRFEERSRPHSGGRRPSRGEQHERQRSSSLGRRNSRSDRSKDHGDRRRSSSLGRKVARREFRRDDDDVRRQRDFEGLVNVESRRHSQSSRQLSSNNSEDFENCTSSPYSMGHSRRAEQPQRSSSTANSRYHRASTGDMQRPQSGKSVFDKRRNSNDQRHFRRSESSRSKGSYSQESQLLNEKLGSYSQEESETHSDNIFEDFFGDDGEPNHDTEDPQQTTDSPDNFIVNNMNEISVDEEAAGGYDDSVMNNKTPWSDFEDPWVDQAVFGDSFSKFDDSNVHVQKDVTKTTPVTDAEKGLVTEPKDVGCSKDSAGDMAPGKDEVASELPHERKAETDDLLSNESKAQSDSEINNLDAVDYCNVPAHVAGSSLLQAKIMGVEAENANDAIDDIFESLNSESNEDSPQTSLPPSHIEESTKVSEENAESVANSTQKDEEHSGKEKLSPSGNIRPLNTHAVEPESPLNVFASVSVKGRAGFWDQKVSHPTHGEDVGENQECLRLEKPAMSADVVQKRAQVLDTGSSTMHAKSDSTNNQFGSDDMTSGTRANKKSNIIQERAKIFEQASGMGVNCQPDSSKQASEQPLSPNDDGSPNGNGVGYIPLSTETGKSREEEKSACVTRAAAIEASPKSPMKPLSVGKLSTNSFEQIFGRRNEYKPGTEKAEMKAPQPQPPPPPVRIQTESTPIAKIGRTEESSSSRSVDSKEGQLPSSKDINDKDSVRNDLQLSKNVSIAQDEASSDLRETNMTPMQLLMQRKRLSTAKCPISPIRPAWTKNASKPERKESAPVSVLAENESSSCQPDSQLDISSSENSASRHCESENNLSKQNDAIGDSTASRTASDGNHDVQESHYLQNCNGHDEWAEFEPFNTQNFESTASPVLDTLGIDSAKDEWTNLEPATSQGNDATREPSSEASSKAKSKKGEKGKNMLKKAPFVSDVNQEKKTRDNAAESEPEAIENKLSRLDSKKREEEPALRKSLSCSSLDIRDLREQEPPAPRKKEKGKATKEKSSTKRRGRSVSAPRHTKGCPKSQKESKRSPSKAKRKKGDTSKTPKPNRGRSLSIPRKAKPKSRSKSKHAKSNKREYLDDSQIGLAFADVESSNLVKSRSFSKSKGRKAKKGAVKAHLLGLESDYDSPPPTPPKSQKRGSKAKEKKKSRKSTRKLDIGGGSPESDDDAPPPPKSQKRLSKSKKPSKSNRKFEIDNASPPPSPPKSKKSGKKSSRTLDIDIVSPPPSPPKSQRKSAKEKKTKRSSKPPKVTTTKPKSFKTTKKEMNARRKFKERVEEAMDVQEQLYLLNQETRDIIRALQANMEASKRAVLSKMRKEQGLDDVKDDDALEAEADAAEFLKEELQRENDELKTEITKMKQETPSLQKENLSLLETNANVQSMTSELNAFVAKKTQQNKKLEQSHKQLDGIYNGLIGLEYEQPMKEIVRKWMYKIAQRVSQTVMDDPNVFSSVQDAVNDCEFGLGIMPLDIASYDAARVVNGTAKVNAGASVVDNDAFLGDVAADQDDLERSIDELDTEMNGYADALDQVSSKLDKKQFNMLIAIFKLLDKDKNGSIDPEEFRTGISMLNRRLPAASKIEDADQLFKVLDADGSGTIDLEEFQQLHISM